MRSYDRIRRLRRPIRASVLAALALSALPAGASAQKTLCFNGSPLPACSSFLIVELGGVLPVLQTTRTVQHSWPEPVRATAFEDRLQWELGMMRNVGDRWALGGTARLGPGSQGALTGLTVRGRRWLNEDLGVDVSAGASFRANGYGGRDAGPLADVRLNFRDDLYAGVRWESTVLPRVHEEMSDGQLLVDDPGGRQHALSLLLGSGSEWAMGGSAVVGLSLLVFLLAFDPS